MEVEVRNFNMKGYLDLRFSTIYNLDYCRKDRRYFLYELLDRMTVALNTHIIAISQAVKDFVVEWKKIDEKKISLILNGTVAEKYSDPGVHSFQYRENDHRLNRPIRFLLEFIIKTA